MHSLLYTEHGALLTVLNTAGRRQSRCAFLNNNIKNEDLIFLPESVWSLVLQRDVISFRGTYRKWSKWAGRIPLTRCMATVASFVTSLRTNDRFGRQVYFDPTSLDERWPAHDVLPPPPPPPLSLSPSSPPLYFACVEPAECCYLLLSFPLPEKILLTWLRLLPLQCP